MVFSNKIVINIDYLGDERTGDGMESDYSAQINAYSSYLHEWNASYEEYAKSVGLSFTSLTILCAIYRMERCTQKLLCEQCFLPKQTVNAAVTAFYKKGWVRLEELPEDRRNKTIHFTELGRTEAERILSKVRQSEQTAMGSLTEEERRILLSATRRYVTGCKAVLKGLKESPDTAQ